MRRTLRTMAVVGGLVALAACSAGDVDLTDPGQLADSGSRIVGGSTYDGLPAVGAITYNGQQHCTGTLIGPRKVLTAAHCVHGFSATAMRFVIGPDIWSPQHTLRVAAVQAHPNYNANTIANDIGFLTLSADAPIAPLPVLASMGSSWVGTNLFFVGYGVNNGYNQTGAGTKRAVWMTISRVEATNFRYQDSGKNTCNGDSGGPAFYRDASNNYFVAGVTSYGDAYCTQYGVDTRVDAYLTFLGVSGGGGSQPTDPCNGETWAGRCDGNTVVWCEDEEVKSLNCAASGKKCKWSASKGYFDCLK